MPIRSLHLLALACCIAALTACDATPGRLVAFEMESALRSGPSDTPTTFVTDTGWTVTLTTGLVAAGPLYLFEDPSTVAAAPRLQRGLRAVGELLLPSARAHPGDDFFAGGQVLGEWPDQWVMDVGASAPRALGRSAGIEGRVRSGALLLQRPTVPNASRHPGLEGHAVLLAGVAERAGEQVPFRIAVDYPESLAEQRVSGIPADFELAEGARVTLALWPAAALAGADFAGLADPRVPADHPLALAVRINLRRAATWSLTAAP